DPLVGERTETGSHTVDRRSRADELLQAPVRALDALAGGWCQAQPFHATAEDMLGVIEAQAIPVELQHSRDRGSPVHGVIISRVEATMAASRVKRLAQFRAQLSRLGKAVRNRETSGCFECVWPRLGR